MPHTLLLADDSVTIQRVIALTFADEDVEVVAVSDGDQAIARLEASPPDIVLADIGMPGKSGYEVAQYIRQSPRLAHIPVMLLTGAFEPVDQARAAASGCDGVLAKPFEPHLVIARVKELLARPGPASRAIGAVPPPATHAPDHQWAPPPAEPAAAAPPSASEPMALDDYFDRLDAAFSNLPSTNAAPPPPVPPAAIPEIDWFAMTAMGAPEAPPADPPAPAAQAEPPLAPLTYASPPPEAPAPPFESPAIEAPASQAEPAPLAAFDPGPDYAPLEPEHAAAAAAVVAPVPTDRRWPPPAPEAPAAPAREVAAPAAPPAPVAAARPAELPALADAFAALLAAEQGEPAPSAAPAWPATPPVETASDAFVDDVVRRVLERLSDQVVRDTVGGIVSKVAEQLVRDEIEKIKAALK